MTTALPLLVAAITLAAVTPATAPSVAALEAIQAEPIPSADVPGPLSFRVAVRGRCTDADHALSVAGMLGDTLSAWQAPDADGNIALALEVPPQELGFAAAPLCLRAGPGAGTQRVLPGAFSAQVFARCTAADGRAATRAASTPLTLRYTCPVEPADR